MKPTQKVIDFFTNTLFPVGFHMFQILPDALLVFLAIFSFLTQNFANGLLVFSLLEATAVYSLLSPIAGYFVPGIAPTNARVSGSCIAGFPKVGHSYATLSFYKSWLPDYGFPSGPVSLLATLIGYLLSSLFQFNKELRALGADWNTRVPIATTLSFLVLLAFVLFRYIAGCEGLGTLLLSMLLGLVGGTALMYQNGALFGKEALNVLGLPILVNKTAKGQAIYVCEGDGDKKDNDNEDY